MKKHFLLIFTSFILVTACKKQSILSEDAQQAQNPKFKVNTETGGGATPIVYNATLGKYTANFGGADLVFDAIPNNTDFKDNDIAAVTMQCTNCSFFQNASGGYFIASIPALTSLQAGNIGSELLNYEHAFDDFIKGKIDTVTSAYVQPTLPNFPSSSSAFSITVKGIVVRSHASTSTCVIYSLPFTPNPPPRQIPNGTPYFIGSIASTITPGVVYDFYGASGSNVITTVNYIGLPTVDITWSGSFTNFTDSNGTHHRITVNIYHNNVLYEQFTNIQSTEDYL